MYSCISRSMNSLDDLGLRGVWGGGGRGVFSALGFATEGWRPP